MSASGRLSQILLVLALALSATIGAYVFTNDPNEEIDWAVWVGLAGVGLAILTWLLSALLSPSRVERCAASARSKQIESLIDWLENPHAAGHARRQDLEKALRQALENAPEDIDLLTDGGDCDAAARLALNRLRARALIGEK